MVLLNAEAKGAFVEGVLTLGVVLGFIGAGALGGERLHGGRGPVGKGQECCRDCSRGRTGAAKEQTSHCSCSQPNPEQMVHSYQGGSALSPLPL